MSWVAYSRLDEASADDAIQEQVDYFPEMKQRFSWDVYDHDTPPDFQDHLAAHGFERESPPDDPGALLVLDLPEASPTLLQPVRADIRRITQRDQLDDVIRVEEQVLGGNFGWIKKRMGTPRHPQRWQDQSDWATIMLSQGYRADHPWRQH